MRTKRKLAITGILSVALILTCIPSSVYGALYESGSELFSCYKGMTEDEIYSLKKNDSANDLIEEIMGLEKELPKMDDKMAILPHLTALVDKKDEFTDDELLELIKRTDTDTGLDSAFVKMYVGKGADASKLLPLLEDENVDLEVKEYIVAIGDFSKEELRSIFLNNDDSVSVIAMKKLTVLDEAVAYEIASQLLRDDSHQMTSEQYVSACLGIAEHFEVYQPVSESDRKAFSEERLRAISLLWNLYYANSDELVQDQAIYALGRMHDYDVFKSIIESSKIDFYLKVTVIEENAALMVDLVSNASSLEEIEIVVTAMSLHPITDVGEVLSEVVTNGRLLETKEIKELIDYIKNEGVMWVDKYDK